MAAIPWPNGTGVAEGFTLPAEFGPKRLSFQNGVSFNNLAPWLLLK